MLTILNAMLKAKTPWQLPGRVRVLMFQHSSFPMKNRAIMIVLFPFRYPTTFETAYFGGTLKHLWT